MEQTDQLPKIWVWGWSTEESQWIVVGLSQRIGKEVKKKVQEP
jgi:hypothetical protein